MTKEIVSPMITKEQIDERLTELARRIDSDFEGKTLTVVCTLKGAVVFFADLVKKLNIQLKMDFIEAASYGDAQNSSGIVKISRDLTNTIAGEHVLLIEDIVDTGATLSQLKAYLLRQKPQSFKICALLDKPSRRIVSDAEPDYVGFVIEDKFVLGYGLDYLQRYRNLPYIGTMKLIEQ